MARQGTRPRGALRIPADDRAEIGSRQAAGHRKAAIPAAVLAACALLGCGGSDAPEARVRALLERAEAAAEARETAVLGEAISERYADAAGRDRQAVVAILAYTFLRHQSIHLLTRHHEVTIAAPGRALAVAFVAMAGTPIPAVEDLAGLRADLYRFAFELEEEDGEWRVMRADWRPARREDFL